MEPTEPRPPDDDRPSFERYEIPEPLMAPKGRRTPTLTTAAVVLLVSGLLGLLVVLGFRPEGSLVILLLVLAILQLVTAGLVVVLHPVGRGLGIVLGAVGIVVGVVGAGDNAVNGLVTILLNGFVIYALAVSGPSFRRG